jgi:uncharacterized membrane protein YbhN (UPF0104 family)
LKVHRRHLVVLAKWAWLALVIGCVAVFMVTKREVIAENFARFSFPVLLASTTLLLLGKLALNAAMLVSARQCSIQLGRRDGFYVYNVAQLAKYVPGSIWQFVSRIAMLRARQAPAVAIRDSMIAENGWVIGSAVLLGSALVWLGQPGFFLRLAMVVAGAPPAIRILLATGLAVALGLGILWGRRRWPQLLRWLIRLRPPGRAVLLLLVAWLALGASFWVCLRPFLSQGPTWLAVIGVYCLAWVAGFLVPFAPAGLGVREAVLALALDPFLDPQTSLVVVAVHRVIYLFVEVLLALLAWMAGPEPVVPLP